jgi:murein tripeptide amidase MpaA
MSKKPTRFLFILIAVAMIFGMLASSQSATANNPLPDRQVLVVPFEDRDSLKFLADHYDVVEVDHDTQTVKIFSDSFAREALAKDGYGWTVDYPYTIEINREVKALPNQVSGIPGYPCYRTITEIYARAAELATQYPNLVEIIDIGDSWKKVNSGGTEGYDIEVFLITNKSNPETPKSVAFYMSNIHAREWTPPEANLRLAEHLLANYGSDPDITWMLDYTRVHLVFVTNPDGRAKDEENHNYSQRKNMNANHCPGQTGGYGQTGVDLNRNYPFVWSGSNDQCNLTYPGTSAGSEPETVAITTYVRGIFEDQRGPNPLDPAPETATGMFLDLHSYSELVLFPWGYTNNNAPNHDQLKHLAYKFAYYNKYDPKKSTELYPTDGSTDDFAYGELGVPAFCFEMGNAFHEGCSAFESNIWPDNKPALLRGIKLARRPYMDTYGPEVTFLTKPTRPVNPTLPMVLSVQIDDTLYSGFAGGVPSQKIKAIRYSFDKPSWIEGANPKIIERNFTGPKVDATLALDINGLTPGRHMLFMEGQDVSGKWGIPTAIYFTVAEGNPTPTPSLTPTPSPTPSPSPTPTPEPIEGDLFFPVIISKED